MNKLSWYNIEPIKMPNDIWYDVSDNQLKSEFPKPKYFNTSDGVVISFDNFSVFVIGKVNRYGMFNKSFTQEEAEDMLDIQTN